jgi:Bacterial type II/III secretion system short domain
MPRKAMLVLLLSMTGLALSAVGQSETTVRVFNLKNVSVVEAFTAIEPLLSNDGSVTVQPFRGRVTIQDSPQIVSKITTLIDELDRIPGEYRIEVELLEGLDSEWVSDLPPELDRRLHRMFPFKSYRRAGRTVFQGEFGQPTAASLSQSYRLSFLAESSSVSESTPWGVADIGDRTQVKWLRLDRLTSKVGGGEKIDELLRTTVFLSPQQKMIIGAGSSEDSASGLVLILTMHSVEDR